MPFDVSVAYEVEPAALDAATVRALAEAVLIAERVEDGAAVSIVFTDDATVRVLNREHRDVDATTDVLSFGLSEAVENASGR
ncbi:MAG: rRNA maturation RNase YbeY [Dehalococcoidia bacterium]